MNDNPDSPSHRFEARKCRVGLKIVRVSRKFRNFAALLSNSGRTTADDTVFMKPALVAATNPFYQ